MSRRRTDDHTGTVIPAAPSPQTKVSFDPYGRFLKLADVMQSIGVSQAMVYKLMRDERLPFPKPVQIGRVSVWIERDVVAWKARVAGEVEALAVDSA